jgi:hypothetical protein
MGVYSVTGTNYFINAGTLEKTAASGTSTIDWSLSNNGGTINTLSGAFSMGNWIGNGVVHGTATFSGGTMTGTLASDCMVTSSATITGSMFISSNAVANWSGGDLEGSLTVEQGGTLTQSNTLHFVYNNYALGYTNTAYLTNYGTVIWAGTIDAAANGTTHGGGGVIYNAGLWDAVADLSMGVYSVTGTNYFINAGTLEKTAATGTSTIGWSFSSSGIIQTYSGTFNLNWGGPSVLHGNLALSGTIATPLTVGSNAVLNISNGDLESALTIAQGGTLIQSNTLHFAYNNYALGYTNTAYLTNYGTVVWAGTIDAAGNASSHGGGGIIYNAGLWKAVADLPMGSYSGVGTNYFINTGTLEKTAATGTSMVDWNFDSEGGTLTTLSGDFTFSRVWSANSVVYGNSTVSGPIAGIIASNGVVTWLGGDLESSLTVAQGGTLIQSNTLQFAYNNYALGYTNTAYLTNYGTVVWQGTIYASGNASSHGGGGVIYNAGLWDAVADLSMGVYSGTGTNYFINTGTLEKTVGSGTSMIGWTVENSGIIGSQTNTLSLTGIYDLAAGTLNSGINGPGNYGIIHLSGSPAVLAGSLSANFNNGYVAATGSSFPILTYSAESGTFTNFNLPFAVAWQTNYGGAVFTLTVLNVRPVFQTIAARNIDELTPLNVSATATDMDAGQSLTYALVSGPGELTVSPAGAIAWTPSEAEGPSSNAVVVKVTDNGTPALSATNSFVVTVNEINVPPQLTVPVDQAVNEQTTLNVSASATDSDIPVNPLTFALVSPPGGMTIDTNTGAISWMPTEAQGPGVYTVHVVVTDLNTNAINQQSFSVTNSFNVTVNEVNTAPTLSLPSNTNIDELTSYSANATATDSDIPANPLTFALVSGPSGLTVSPSGAISWMPSEAEGPSTNIVTISVTDTNPAAVNAKSLSVTNSYQIIVREVNTAPTLTLPPNTNIDELTSYSANATATDSDIPGNPLTFALVSGPSGLTVSPSGAISWMPSEAEGPSTNIVTISVTDTNPAAVNAKSLSVTNSYQIIVREVNTAPTLTAMSDQTVNAGQTVSFTATATDSDIPTNILTFSLMIPPAGASINGSSGLFNWRPTVAQANTTNVVQVQVTDNGTPNLSDTKSFTVIVNPLAPVVLIPLGYTNGQFKIQINGTTGPDYIIMAGDKVTGLTDVITNFSPATPFQYTVTNGNSATNHFFRVRLSP